MTGAASPARAAAARVLERVLVDAAFADLALDAALDRARLSERDRALATEVAYGTLRWQRYLDWLLAPHCDRPLQSLDPWPLVLLRMSAYQIVFLERVPAFAVVNDAVTLARRRAAPGVAGLVNAVLRAFTRAGARGRRPAAPADPIDALAVRCSFPTWLARRWAARWGVAEAEALMRAMNERPPLTLRANTLKTTREALAVRLMREQGLAARPTAFTPEGLIAEHGGRPSSWRAFAAGEFAVQDEASMLVARLLDARPGQTVADVCAAPGTKTTHLGQLMADRGRLLAFDPQPARLKLVAEAAGRLGVTIVETVEGPVEALADRFRAACDRVLVDAPCSNLGVLRRNPDVKWRRRPDEPAANAARQRTILAAAARMLKRGGRLVYATCSLEPEENEDVVRDVRALDPALVPDPPAAFPIGVDSDAVLRCLPHRHATDGFTAIRLRRL